MLAEGCERDEACLCEALIGRRALHMSERPHSRCAPIQPQLLHQAVPRVLAEPPGLFRPVGRLQHALTPCGAGVRCRYSGARVASTIRVMPRRILMSQGRRALARWSAIDSRERQGVCFRILIEACRGTHACSGTTDARGRAGSHGTTARHSDVHPCTASPLTAQKSYVSFSCVNGLIVHRLIVRQCLRRAPIFHRHPAIF
jgi:hypothetical protein